MCIIEKGWCIYVWQAQWTFLVGSSLTSNLILAVITFSCNHISQESRFKQVNLAQCSHICDIELDQKKTTLDLTITLVI